MTYEGATHGTDEGKCYACGQITRRYYEITRDRHVFWCDDCWDTI